MPSKEYYLKNKNTEIFKQRKKESDKKYRLKNTEKLKIKKKLYYQKIKNTESFKENRRSYNKLYNQTTKRKEWNKLYKRKNYQKDKERQDIYWANNPDSLDRRKIWIKNYNKTYKKQHKSIINLQKKIRSKNDYNFKMRNTLRSRIWTVLKRKKTTQLASTLTLLGVDNVATVINHIEKQFKNKMNWNNHGEWHIDHIKPCASFDLKCPVQQLACFNYNNLQPLWASENMSKGAKIL
jgi:hypothetical protein